MTRFRRSCCVPMERQSRRESRRGASTDWGFCQMSRIAEIGWNIIAARKYDVYGMVRSGQLGSSSQKYVGSLGHESEGNTGLIYMRARYMDPVLGRFISEDPSRDGVNWFVYCGDEPVNHVDPNGKIEWEGFLGALFMVIGGALMVAAYVFEAATLMVIGLVLFVAGLGLWAYDAYHTEDEVGKAGTNQV